MPSAKTLLKGLTNFFKDRMLRRIILRPQQMKKNELYSNIPPCLSYFGRARKQTSWEHSQPPRWRANWRLSVVPIITPSVSSHAFTVTCLDGEKYSIRWQQYALTRAYAFTDINLKAQTQTIWPIHLPENYHPSARTWLCQDIEEGTESGCSGTSTKPSF